MSEKMCEHTLEKTFRELSEKIPDSVTLGKTARLTGTLAAPSSKSYTHRAIMVGGLGQKSEVARPLICADTVATALLWEKLGAGIEWDESACILRIDGTDGAVRPVGDTLNVGEAGTLLRLALPGLAQSDGPITVHGEGSIRSRPNSSVTEPLRRLGVDIRGTGAGDCVPIRINGKGPIECGDVRVDGGQSSQAISAFLLWSPMFKAAGAEGVTTITVQGGAVSRPYVEITNDVLRQAGIAIETSEPSVFVVGAGQIPRTDGRTLEVGGDWSSAAFILAAACLVESDVTLTGLAEDRQGDRAILGILQSMGAQLTVSGDAVSVRGPVALEGLELDCVDTPDLVPVLTALACFARGPSRFFNVGHLKIKESNRLAAPAEELQKLGASIRLGESEIAVEPAELKPGRVSSHGDHRLAMALAVAGMRLPGLEIEGVRSIMKSYPSFLDDMRALGARL